VLGSREVGTHSTAVLGEVARPEAAAEADEGAAGFDLGQVARVTDQHDFDPGALGAGEEPFELAGADHGRLVHDHHLAGG